MTMSQHPALSRLHTALQLVLSQVQLGFARWPFKWQLANVWIWLKVQSSAQAPKPFRSLAKLQPAQQERLNLYCQMTNQGAPPEDGITAPQISLRRHSHYAGDLLRCLNPHFLRQRFLVEFGDVTWIPDRPTFVKSRPISSVNHNAVLLPLDVRRHMCFPRDPYPFEAKKPLMVWRGAGYQPHRQRFLSRSEGLPFSDIGDPGLPTDHAHHRPWLSIHQQLQFKYIISIEGNDVATNLKWIMHSNSLCLMPKPRFETWFLESRLVAGVHYAEIADDFSNLEDLFVHYEKHPEEALAIIQQAQHYTHQFLNPAAEHLLAKHVCQSYFEAHQPI
mgnify:FL=1